MKATERAHPLRFDLAQQLQALETKRGRIWCWRVVKGVYATEVEGHLDYDMAQVIIKQVTPMYAQGAVDGFHCWFAMTGYDSQARVELTNWVLRNRAGSRLFIGLQSRLVAMGVSVANLALGNMIQTFSTPQALEAALDAGLRSR